MQTTEEFKKWLISAGRAHRWGARLLYGVAFTVYCYFMYLDRLFADSLQPFIIGSLAFLLVVPVAVLPMDWWLRYRVWKMGRAIGVESDRFTAGNKLAVLPDGTLQKFIPKSSWRENTRKGVFAMGYVRTEPANEAVQQLHKDVQEHLAWSRVVLGESKTLNWLFILLNMAVMMLTPVKDMLLQEMETSLLFVTLAMFIWMMALIYIQEELVEAVYKKLHHFILVIEGAYAEQPHFALAETGKTDAIIRCALNDGYTTKLQAVTLSGGLVYAVYRNDVLVEHLMIENRK